MAEIAGGTLLPQQTGACVCAHQRACQCCTLPSRLIRACLTHTWTWIGTEGQRLSSSWLCCASHLHTNAAASRVPFSARVPFVLHSSVTPCPATVYFRSAVSIKALGALLYGVVLCVTARFGIDQSVSIDNTDTDTKCFVIFFFPQDRVWIFLVNRKYSSTPGVTNTVPLVTR